MKPIILLLVSLYSSLTLASDYLVARLAADKSVIISSEVSGVVDSYQYDSGDNVSQGEPLLAISTRDYQLNVDLAKYEMEMSQSELAIQEKQLQRYQSLFNSKGIAASDLDNQINLTNTSRARFNISKTNYEIAQRTLKKSMPAAPFSAVIVNRAVESGQFISVGDPLYTIADTRQLKARFYLLERDFHKLAKGDQVRVTVPSTGISTTGTVTLLSPSVQASDPGFLVEVTLSNPEAKLSPGMESRIYVQDDEAAE